MNMHELMQYDLAHKNLVDEINAASIYIKYVSLSQVPDNEKLVHYNDFLSFDERVRMMQFRSQSDQIRFLITRALIRTLLSQCVDTHPKQWRFEPDQYGKPRVVTNDPFIHRLSFNISHTKGGVVAAIGLDRALGIDVENVRLNRATTEVVNRFFAPFEIQQFFELPESERLEFFFQIWTLKESYIKARGIGLALALEKIGFYFKHGKFVKLALDPEIQDSSEGWIFQQFRPTSDHIIALCAEASSNYLSHVWLDCEPYSSNHTFDI